MSYVLMSDPSKCKDCFHCETIRAGFKKAYDGWCLISSNNYKIGYVKDTVDRLIAECPNKAISLEVRG